ncbi:MAG: hypothetical protein M1816_000638 [Peltula sp. TS41687]|nr:MAG: hypothetical protein M1816_000638 [Peltula sp. TS41687]
MSAPAQGRNSPEPSDQSDAQQQGVPASGKADAAPSDTHAKEVSDESKTVGLESNPTGPMEQAAGRKV